ncbi:hypothetical protein, partial [Pseudomonas aeruginosa]|uniref:hypothetical protein n=1 Tax=Pseudomonas aeruginosa TaxID=287 RepID=UPI003CEFEE37
VALLKATAFKVGFLYMRARKITAQERTIPKIASRNQSLFKANPLKNNINRIYAQQLFPLKTVGKLSPYLLVMNLFLAIVLYRHVNSLDQ